MFEIKIFGEIISEIGDYREWGISTITSLENQLNEANGQDLLVRLNSVGGDVDTGFMMFNALRRYADENNSKITTRADGQVASIATVVFLAGDTRIANAFIEPFVHNAWSGAIGDAEAMELAAEELRKANVRIAQHYASITDLTEEEALQMMADDTFIDLDSMLDTRFATEVERVSLPSAMKRNVYINKNKKFNSKKQKMSDNNQTAIEKGFKNLEDMISGLFKKNDQPTNKIIADVNGVQLDFVDVDVDEKISIGNTVTGEGVNPDGMYLINEGKTTVKLLNGKVDSITDNTSNAETLELQNSLSAKDKEILELKNSIKAKDEEYSKGMQDVKASIENMKKEFGSNNNFNKGNGNVNKKKNPFKITDLN